MRSPTCTSRRRKQARGNLLREGADPARVCLRATRLIDALLQVVERLRPMRSCAAALQQAFHNLDDDRRMISSREHRRENFGEKFVSFC